MRSWLQSPFVYFAAILFIVEIAARALYSPDESLAAHNLRNTTPLRGWPEYTQRQGDTGEVILIGNSQALGQEFGDVESIYTSRLDTELGKEGIGFRNWSVSGLRTDQMEFMVMQAIQHKPHTLVFVAGPTNQSHYQKYLFTSDLTDLHLTVGDASIWPQLKQNFFARDLEIKDVLLRSWKLNTRIGRSRERLYDELAPLIDNHHHRHIFGHKRSKLALFSIDEREDDSPTIPVRPLQNKMSAERWAEQFRQQRLPTFEQFYQHLSQRLDDHNIGLLWVWMPFALREDTDTLLAGMQQFYREACAIVTADGNTCIDLSESLSAAHFLSPDISSHLNRKGHRAFGEILAPIIKDAIH